MNAFVRSVAAVLAGFFAVAVLSVATDALMHATGIFPPVPQRMPDAMFVIPGLYRAFYTVLGGYLTARFAPYGRRGHAAVLAVLGTLGGLAGMSVQLQNPELGPMWYAASIPLSAFPCIFLGAQLREIELKRAAPPRETPG